MNTFVFTMSQRQGFTNTVVFAIHTGAFTAKDHQGNTHAVAFAIQIIAFRNNQHQDNTNTILNYNHLYVCIYQLFIRFIY